MKQIRSKKFRTVPVHIKGGLKIGEVVRVTGVSDNLAVKKGVIYLPTVLQIRDVYPGSWIRIFHPGSRVKKIPDSGSTSKNISIFNQDRIFYPFRIPNQRVKRAPDPGSGALITYCF
jgi:hypothetical protein